VTCDSDDITRPFSYEKNMGVRLNSVLNRTVSYEYLSDFWTTSAVCGSHQKCWCIFSLFQNPKHKHFKWRRSVEFEAHFVWIWSWKGVL